MKIGTLPIPRWKADRDYYSRNDPRYKEHIRHIDLQNYINSKINASSNDGSYSIVITRKEI